MPRSGSRGRAPRNHAGTAFGPTPAPHSSVAVLRSRISQHGLRRRLVSQRISALWLEGRKPPIREIEHIDSSLVNVLWRLGPDLLLPSGTLEPAARCTASAQTPETWHADANLPGPRLQQCESCDILHGRGRGTFPVSDAPRRWSGRTVPPLADAAPCHCAHEPRLPPGARRPGTTCADS